MGDEYEEKLQIERFLDEVAGYGGDEQWRGDWYPVGFIADSYFGEYAQDLAEDIGAIDRNSSWPNNYINWEGAAEALKQDYSYVSIGDKLFWYR